ncbi:MAG: tRNA pseudouridine(38-40) synthase TruA [Proteobacteria bacterium]|nr:MAG: tRNA pseudouridine(38-40) synthase TruA [Pseudomonadota bacterium]
MSMESISVSKDSADPKPAFYTYRIDMNYSGGDFSGWQSQPSGNTIQDALEKALFVALRKKIRVVGASRTDTGVHAEHQVASFRIDEEIDCPRVFRSLQALVPPSIGILGLRAIEREFHPIKSAHAKLYRYRLWVGRGTNNFIRPYSWIIPYQLDTEAMKRAGEEFIGYHHFKSFAAIDGSSLTFERNIIDLKWVNKGNGVLEFYILGEGFLKQMVRNIVGTLIEVGQGKKSPADIPRILAAADRRAAGMTAPAQGLSLVEIYYEEQKEIEARFLQEHPEFSFVFPSL